MRVQLSNARLDSISGAAVRLGGDCLPPHGSMQKSSTDPRWMLFLDHRATDAFPIHMRDTTAKIEAHARVVRG